MTEILTTGLKGLYNRINLFSTIIQKDVIDVTVFMNDVSSDNLAANRVMMTIRTENMMMNGRDLSLKEFGNILSNDGGDIISKKEYEKVKEMYQPEYNTGTDKIGEGCRKIGNMVMLTTRGGFNIQHGHDFMLYEYIQMLLENSVIKEDM
jgi:hypothetical protein